MQPAHCYDATRTQHLSVPVSALLACTQRIFCFVPRTSTTCEAAVQTSCNAFNAFDSKRHHAYVVSPSIPLAVRLWKPGAGRACKRGQLGHAGLPPRSRSLVIESLRPGDSVKSKWPRRRDLVAVNSAVASETRSREGKETNQSQ